MTALAADAARSVASRRVRRSDLGWLLALCWLVGFGLLGWLATMSVLAHQGYGIAAALAAFILLPAIGLWWVARAGAQGGFHLLVIVAMVILLSDTTLRGRSEGMDAQSVVKFALWVSGLLLLPWRVALLRSSVRDLPTAALLLFGLWALAGTTYSITPLYTFAAALAFLGLWVTAVVFASSVDIGRGLWWVTGALLALLVASLILYLVAPQLALAYHDNGRMPRLGGVVGSANLLGRVAALALLLVLLSGFYLRLRHTVLLLAVALPVCGACLMLSQSRSSMLALTAGLAAVVARRWPILIGPVLLLGVSGLVLVFGYPGLVDALVDMVSRSGRVSEVTTFTGRTEIWRFVLSAIAEAPVLGHGFASTRELIPAGYVGAYGWTTASAHNLWLQACVTTGVIGLALILGNQFGVLRSMWVRPLPLRDGVGVFVICVGLFEPGPVGPSVSLLTFVWIWATALSLRGPSSAAPMPAGLQRRGSAARRETE